MAHRNRPFIAAIVAGLWLIAACGHDTQTGPTPTVSEGVIAQSPASAGLLGATAFTFSAVGFTSSDGGTLTYTWDFGDHTQSVGGATVVHTYTIDWPVFNVSVTAANSSGRTADAVRWGVRVYSFTGRWGIRDATGRLLLGTTDMIQSGTSVAGEESWRDCRYAVTGSVASPHAVFLTYTRAQGACTAYNLPPTFTFSGSADDAAYVFTGTMTPGGPARLLPCDEAWECFDD